MFRIIEKNGLAAGVFRYVVKAPDIALKAQAGQFVILRLNERGERIPVTIADADPEQGTLTLFVQVIGKTTMRMSRIQTGGSILDLVGPLGLPTEIERFSRVLLVGGGLGIAAIHPIAKEMQRAGNETLSILGAKTEDLILLRDEIEKVSEVHVATEDGSLGMKGWVTDILSEKIADGKSIDRVIAIGPLAMMKAVTDLTRPLAIKTIVSLNPIMVDGTGMCGACRVTVDSQMKFACVDGPEFDGHLVDFESLIQRLKTYTSEEQNSRDRFLKEADEECRLEENRTPA